MSEDRVTVISVGSRLMCLCSCWTISQSELRSIFRLTGEAAVWLIALYWWSVSVDFPLRRGGGLDTEDLYLSFSECFLKRDGSLL